MIHLDLEGLNRANQEGSMARNGSTMQTQKPECKTNQTDKQRTFPGWNALWVVILSMVTHMFELFHFEVSHHFMVCLKMEYSQNPTVNQWLFRSVFSIKIAIFGGRGSIQYPILWVELQCMN
jgi:hypothetical protein